MSTGSLGQGLSPGLGMALGGRKLGLGFRTYVMVATEKFRKARSGKPAHRRPVQGRFAHRDPRLQQVAAVWLARRDRIHKEEPFDHPQKKFRAFGWNTVECDGHDHGSIESAIEEAKACTGVPTVIIAHTIKGKGVSFMEGDFNWHAKVPTQSELDAAIDELTEAGSGDRKAA